MELGLNIRKKIVWFVLAFIILGMGEYSYGSTDANKNDLTADYNQKMDIVFVIDNSGSMKHNDPQFITKEVVTNFFDELNYLTNVGMVIFDQSARLVEPLMERSGAEANRAFIESLQKVNYKGQYTNSPEGVERAIYELKTNGRKDAQKVIIFLTDGIVDTGNKLSDIEKAKWLKEDLTKESKKAGIRIFGIAFTEKADVQLIQSLAIRTNGEYFRAYNAKDISEIFNEIDKIIKSQLEDKALLASPSVDSSKASDIDLMSPPDGADTFTQIAPISGTLQTELADDPNQPKTTRILKPEAYHTTQTDANRKNVLSLIFIMVAVVTVGAIVFIKFFKGKPKDLPEPFVGEGAQGLAPRPEAPIPAATLIDMDNICSKESLPLTINKSRITIGRNPNNDVVIPQKTISSLHATITYRDGYFYLEDNRSTNRTSINNKLIGHDESIRLKSGDKIFFAVYKFKFLMIDQIPVGETIMLGSSSVALGFGDMSSPESEGVEIDDYIIFKDCFDKHLQKVIDLGDKYESFVHQNISDEIVDLLAFKAKEVMSLAQMDFEGHCMSLAKPAILYQLCALPVEMQDAKTWFGKKHGGFTKFLNQSLHSDSFTKSKCTTLCLITYGRTEDAWISLTIAQTDPEASSMEIMSVEFLTEEEKNILSLDFGDMGKVV